MNITTVKTAGVTFKNDDGENRQTILANLNKLSFGWICCRLVPCLFTNPKTKVNEPAIKVFEKKTKKLIGYIPKTKLSIDLVKATTLTGHIRFYKDKYSCELSVEQTPSSSSYFAVKTICKKNNLPMPTYDTRPYIAFFAFAKANGLYIEAKATNKADR